MADWYNCPVQDVWSFPFRDWLRAFMALGIEHDVTTELERQASRRGVNAYSAAPMIGPMAGMR